MHLIQILLLTSVQHQKPLSSKQKMTKIASYKRAEGLLVLNWGIFGVELRGVLNRRVFGVEVRGFWCWNERFLVLNYNRKDITDCSLVYAPFELFLTVMIDKENFLNKMNFYGSFDVIAVIKLQMRRLGVALPR